MGRNLNCRLRGGKRTGSEKLPVMRGLLSLLIAVCLSGCQSEPAPTAAPEGSASPSPTPGISASPQSQAGEKTVRVHKSTIKTKQGQKWELEAEEVDWMDDRSKAKARDVDWWLIDEKGERWVQVESPVADIDLDSEIVIFEGETVAQRIGYDENLKVQRLVYKGKERMFYGSEGVEWHRGGVKLSGDTLKADSTLSQVQLKGRVKGKSEGGFKDLSEPRKAESSSED